jgi:hypothetical protein
MKEQVILGHVALLNYKELLHLDMALKDRLGLKLYPKPLI